MAGWAPGPGWTGAENLARNGIRPPDRPARSESVYRLSYPGVHIGLIPSYYTRTFHNLMFFWPCIMNWLYINYQLRYTGYYLFIKYYSPLHVSSLKCSSSGRYSCTHAAYGTLTIYESSWWPVGTQLEWELTVGGRLLVGCLRRPTNSLRPPQSVLTQAVYRQATTNSQREWQYHMLHVHNCILLMMNARGSKHVEEKSILWINNNQCIKIGN